jgi:thiol:disulfide interchange protein DsbD
MQQAHDDRERVRKLGLTFISGIISSFMLLATIVLIIQAAGTKAGWGFQFQFPGFVIAMSAIVTLFALSLFGLFYVSVGHGQALDKLSCKEGYTGTFFKGVLATVLSTPCSAPCLGTALGYAFTQNWLTILAIFFMIGLGMSLPYMVLCFNPDMMKFVPKPGIWMEKFKESLGFVLLATVVWLLWVLGIQVGLLDVIWTLAFLVSLSFAAWFVARFTNLNSNNKQKAIIWGAASLIAGGAFYFFIAIQPGIGFLAPADATNVMPEESAAPASADGITWQPLNLDKLQQYRQSGKTVFLDFTAAWCLTCKANERAVIMSTPVVQKLKALHVVTMQADWTKQDATITKLLNKFGRSGVPLYVIFPGNKPENPIVLPEVIDQDIVIKALDQAGASKP